MRKLLILLFITVWTGYQALAQAENPFENPANWRQISTDNFDVYFFGDNEPAAIQTAKFAEIARYEVGILFDYKPTERYALIYADDAFQLMSSGIHRGKRDLVPGIFNLPGRFSTVVHPGTGDKWFSETKKAVTSLILDEFAFNGRLGSTIQSKLLFYRAPWYKEGLEEYVADGWTYDDELWMNGAVNGEVDLLDLAMEGDGHLNRVVRKSIWHFITHEYGDQKISEILYLINISHSIESGIISVLGITLNTLTDRWREYITARFTNQTRGRNSLREVYNTEPLKLRDGHKLAGFSYNQSKNVVGIWMEKNGLMNLYIYDQETEQYKETGVQSGFSTNESRFLEFDLPLAWDHQGERLATPVYYKGSYKIAYYDLATGDVGYDNVPGEIRKIISIAWSHTGESMAVSALNGHKTDIFTFRVGGGQFRAVTNDIYDDVDPIWSFDDQFIFFSSNRSSVPVTDSTESPRDYFRNKFDLFKYERSEGQDLITAITQTPEVNERQLYPTTSFELVYLTDESGIYNLGQVNIFQQMSAAFSDLSQGIGRMQATERMMALSVPESGVRNLYLIPSSAFTETPAPEPTLLRLEKAAIYQEEIDKENRRKKMNEKLEALEKPDGTISDSSSPDEENEEAGENNEPVKYYIFDEEDEPYEARKPERSLFDPINEPILETSNVFGDMPRPQLKDIKTGRAAEAENQWIADYLGMNVNFDPQAKMGMEFQLGFSDLFKNHRLDIRFQPFFNLKNSITDIRYTYLKNKIDLYGEFGFTNRFLKEPNAFQTDSLRFRYDQVRLQAGARYPLSAFAAIEANIGYNFLDRRDLQLLRAELLNDRDHVLKAGVRFTFDNTLEKEGFKYKGLRIDAGFDSYFSTAQGDFAFHRAKLQVTNYTEVTGKIVLASRFSTAFNFPKSLPQYYMGGVEDRVHPPVVFPSETSIAVRNNTLDTALYSFHYIDFIQSIHGFRPNTRDGSRYLMANFELRIPLSRIMKHSLPTNALYKLEIIPFIDAGTVWVEGNPFSKKEPTDTQIISTGVITVKLQTLKSPFLIGFGSGVRAKILSWSLRMDLGWGIDDYNLKNPMLTTTVGKSF